MSNRSLRFVLLLSAPALFAAAPARASETYPAVMRDTLGLACAPQCIVCHTDNAGGIGTISRNFGIYLHEEKGLLLRSDAQLAQLLTALQSDPHDSDGDGVSDYSDLSNDEDPNGNGALCGGVRYGCGASIAPAANRDPAPPLAAAFTALLLTGLALLRRRR